MANDKNFKVKNGVTVGTDIVFEDTNFSTTLTKTAPTENRTITFPNASGTVVLGNGLTTYSVKASSTTGGANLDLDAAGANTNTDSVKFAGAGISVVTQTDASTITITSTEADTLATVTGRGATTATAVSFTNDTQSTGTGSGAVVISGGLGVAKNLYVGENIVVTGNLTVQGTQTTISTTTLDVADKTIDLGVVETPTDETADGGGIILRGATNKTLLWDNANDNWTSSEHWNLVSGKQFKIDNTAVLTSTQVLGKGFTNAAGEIVTTDGTQTLSNKTISGGSASNLTGLSMTAGVSITEFSSDGTLAGDSDEAVPTEAAVKSYVDGSLTTYSVKASSTTGGANLDLDAAGANTNTDSVKFAGAGSVSVAQTDASTITITGAAPNNGALTLQVGGTAAATNNTVTVATGTGFTADSASASTYELRVGPALTALASQMTGAGSGFLRKNGADTFSLDTTTYLSAEADTLASVTGRGSTTSTAVTFNGGATTTALTMTHPSSTNIITTGNDSLTQIRTRDTSVAATSSGSIQLFTGNATSAAAGNITIYSGNGTTFSSIGNVSIQGGTGTAATTTGGRVLIQGGAANVTATTAGTGGDVVIQGGQYSASSGTQIGGNIIIEGGGGLVTGTKGKVYIGANQSGINDAGTTEVFIGNSSSKNYVRGVTEYTTSTEVLNTKTGATGTVVHNLNEGNTWYHSSIAANFTANFTNVPTTNNRTIVCSLVLVQGSTAYIPNAVQIDGVAQTINWTGHNGVPTGDANDTNIATFILIRQSNAWSVLGSVVNNPASASGGTLQAVTDAGATTSNAISITNTTTSTSTSTGALVVSGGVGVSGNIYATDFYGTGTNLTALTLNNITNVKNIGTNKDTIYIGRLSGNDDTAGTSNNVGIGTTSLYGGTGLPFTGTYNTAIGYGSASQIASGSFNVAIGPWTLFANRSGSNNVAVGSEAGRYVNDGSSNFSSAQSIYIGSDARTGQASAVNEIVIGDGGRGNGSNTVTIGNSSTTNTYLNGNTNISGGLIVSGLTTLQETTEVLNTKTGATGVVTHDFSTGAIWYHSSIAANFTANFTNVPTTDNRTIVLTLILAQGGTPYIPNAVQIDGAAQTINWTGTTGTPTGDANDINIATFSLIRTGSAWTVLGSVVNNPTSFVAGGGIGLAGSTFSVAAGTGLTQDTDGLSLTNITAGNSTVGSVRYNGTTKISGQFYGGTASPTNSTRLNYDGNFYSTRVFSDEITVNGLTTLSETTEILNTKTGATGTVTHDFSTGAIWYHSSIAANFTANFTNVPTTDNRTISVALTLSQGSTAYIPNAVQIDGAAQTIKWQGGTTPSGNANKVDIVSFIFIRTGSAWTVLGSLNTYG